MTETYERKNFQEYEFVQRGCLVDDPFVQRNFRMSEKRVQLSNSTISTKNVDQFEVSSLCMIYRSLEENLKIIYKKIQVDLWDMTIDESTIQKTYIFECRLIGCDSVDQAEA